MPGSIVTTWPASSVSADTVPQAVSELVAEALLRNRLARKRVRLDAGHTRPDAFAGAHLRLEAHVEGPTQPVGERTGREGACAVAAVAVDPHAPVDGDERTRLDNSVG